MADVGGRGDADRPGRGPALLKLTLLVVLVAGGVVAVRLTALGDVLSREGIGPVIAAFRGSGWAPVAFVTVYALATALAIPGTILTLAGGALFGFAWGTIYNSIAANIGANLAFLVGRFLGRDAVEALTGDRLEALDEATRAHGFRGLLTLRLIPLVPFNALNFGSGLTAMSWGTYAGATAVGILPGTVVYTLFADALLAGSQEASREAFVRVLISGGLLVLLSFLPTILKKLDVRLPGSAALVLVAALALPGTGGAAAPTTPGVQVEPEPAQETPSELPDHEAFTRILQEVVVGSRVDYVALEDRGAALDAYLETLAAAVPSRLLAAPPDVRLAFWINAYNACMLDLVAEHYPIEPEGGILDRITNAVAGRPANSVWQIEDVFTRKHCVVAGEPRSQDEIEHEIIRPMGDPRIHFAINCAAVSCPPLVPSAYTGPELDAQLDARVRAFVDDPDHFRLESDGTPTLRLNRVLDWFGEDFGGVEGLRDFFRPYVAPEVAHALDDPATRIAFMEYDWTLNDVPR